MQYGIIYKSIFFSLLLATLMMLSGCQKGVDEKQDPPGGDVPVVVTAQVTDITDSSAICGGSVTSDGGSQVTVRGVVWAETQNPVLGTASSTSDGSGLGGFTSTITGLDTNTAYYIRAYATTAAGKTSYGEERSFTTKSGGGGGGGYPEAPELECVKIKGTVWAPVNCGYDAKKYPYGKLYQWGRRNGGGYNDGDTWTETILQNSAAGPVNVADEDSTKFYTISSLPYDWLTTQNDTRWSSGTETSPVKTDYDPCPTGWRVPTTSELKALIGGTGTKITSAGWDSSKNGHWFDGTTSPKTGAGLFLPAAGGRYYGDGLAHSRGLFGFYWSSSPKGKYAGRLGFFSGGMGMGGGYRASGRSVRCVKE